MYIYTVVHVSYFDLKDARVQAGEVSVQPGRGLVSGAHHGHLGRVDGGQWMRIGDPKRGGDFVVVVVVGRVFLAGIAAAMHALHRRYCQRRGHGL